METVKKKREDEQTYSSGAESHGSSFDAVLCLQTPVDRDVIGHSICISQRLHRPGGPIELHPDCSSHHLLPRGTPLYKPKRAAYGLRRSPRVAGIVQRWLKLKMRKLDSEPNPWRLEEAGTEEESATPSVAYGLVMTYVDDIFITAPAEITKAAAPKFRSSESSGPTSEPETVGETAVRFLGVEISTSKDADSRSVWHITQESFVKGPE